MLKTYSCVKGSSTSLIDILQVQNRELLVGDVLVLVSFCIYKQARPCRYTLSTGIKLPAGCLPAVTTCHHAMLLSTDGPCH